MLIISEFIELWKTNIGKQCIEAIANIQLSESGGTLLPKLCVALNCPEIAHLLKGGGYKRSGKDKGYAYEHMLRLVSIANFFIAPKTLSTMLSQNSLLKIFPLPAGATSINPDLMVAGVGIELKTTSRAEFGHFGVQCFVTADGLENAYWAPIPAKSRESTYVKMGSAWTEGEFNKVRCAMNNEWNPGWQGRMCHYVRTQQKKVESAEEEEEGTGYSAQRMALSLNIKKVICPFKILSKLGEIQAGTEVLLFNGQLPVHGDCELVGVDQAEKYYKKEKKAFYDAYMEFANKDRRVRAKELGVKIEQLTKSDKKIAAANAKTEAVSLTMVNAFMDDHVYHETTPTQHFKNQMEIIAYGATHKDIGKAGNGKYHRGAQLYVDIPPKDFADGYAIKKCQFIQVGTSGLYSCGAPVQLTDVKIPSFQSSLGGAPKMRFRGAEKGTCFGSIVFDVSFILGSLTPSPFNLNNPRELGRKQFINECILPALVSEQVLVTIGHPAHIPLTPQQLSISMARATAVIDQRSRALLAEVTSYVCEYGGSSNNNNNNNSNSNGGGRRRRRKRRTKRRTKRKRTKRKKRRKRRKRKKSRRRRRNSRRKK